MVSNNEYISSLQVKTIIRVVLVSILKQKHYFIGFKINSTFCSLLDFVIFYFLLFCVLPLSATLTWVWEGLCPTDTEQDYHHFTQETTHLSLLQPLFLLLCIQLPIHRLPLFLDFCYPSSGQARVSFPPLSCVWELTSIYLCLSHLIKIKSAPE